jgi:hypothetical protein
VGGNDLESRAAGVVRTIIALVVLLIFWSAVGYTFWPDLMPGLLWTVQSARSIGADTVASQYFEIRNNSDASDAQVNYILKTLEADYQAVLELLNHLPGEPIPVVLTNGQGPAIFDGAQFNIFYDNGVINLDTAPFFMPLAIESKPPTPEMNLFVEVGFAIYVAEEIGRAEVLTGQSADSWVTLLRQKGAFLPLSEAWEITLPENETDAFDLLRALVEGGSFMRWIVDTYGLDAAQALRNGQRLEDVTGLYFDQAQADWLVVLDKAELSPKSCKLALSRTRFLWPFCDQLEGE